MWEAVGFRGQDLNTADIMITAFGDRELIFGEGPVVHSPADIARLLGIPLPTEDDILHADKLPTYGDTLSREEAEALLSFLTVDYVRIPLILGFFASHDRVTYLFNSDLRALLRAVLFESAPWVAAADQCSIQRVPVRRTALQQKQYIEDRFLMANIPEERRVLGTPHGLLLNELMHSPSSTLEPLLKIFYAVSDLRDATVHSSDATFILYLIELAVDVEEYLVYAMDEAQKLKQSNVSEDLKATISNAETDQHVETLMGYHKKMREFLHGLAAKILNRWLIEAEDQHDIQTSSMVHAYLALLWTSLKPNELNSNNVETLLASLAYVRNWHGFGLGQNRSDILWESADGTFDPEMRLLRFLQAQGIDTSRISKAQLDQFIKDAQTKPLFLHLGRKTIRAPRLVKVKEPGSKGGDGVDIESLPPADVPEYRLFAILQKHRRALVAWMEAAPPKVVDNVLQNIIKIALRSGKFEYSGWQRLGHGRFLAERAEIKFDAQTAEIFWRNNELKPVPDSMTRFTDFESLFGGRAFYCGLVLRSQHRHWVHIVGTEYDLQEWDKPKAIDQGVGVPKEPPKQEEIKPNELGQICLVCGQVNKCFACETCTVMNCGVGVAPGTLCTLCGTPKLGMQAMIRQRT